MAEWKTDPSFYPSPRLAGEAPPEELAYVALRNPTGEGRPDALGVVDANPQSASYGQLVGRVDMPNVGDELHHFGWNACSSHLCPWAPHAHVERRYLLLPGIHTSNITIVDTGPDPRSPQVVKVIEGSEVTAKTGYTAPHTVHCGPDGVYLSALGDADGDGPGGIFWLDHETFEIKGAWERDRGPQVFAYDFGWHLGHDVIVASEWGTPNMVTGGVNPELLLAGKYGNGLNVFDLRRRRHVQRLDLGPEQQMVLEVRPARDPDKAYGFVGVVLSLENLSASVWMWYLDSRNGCAAWRARKVIEIPAEPVDADLLPPLLEGFGAVPPLVTDINLSLDDRYLFVSCWGTGELRRYDVRDPFNPVLVSAARLGGIVRRTAHPREPETALNGGPQMVEVSRDGKRVYVTNSLYSPWDEQFYPDGIRGWMAKLDADPDGGMEIDRDFLLRTEEGIRPHQVRLRGGDASSDTFCYS